MKAPGNGLLAATISSARKNKQQKRKNNKLWQLAKNISESPKMLNHQLRRISFGTRYKWEGQSLGFKSLSSSLIS